jgi:hypothetical protein
LTVANVQPTCTAAQGVSTEETANSFYNMLPSAPSNKITQAFSVNDTPES